jgi:hypothetical protein
MVKIRNVKIITHPSLEIIIQVRSVFHVILSKFVNNVLLPSY